MKKFQVQIRILLWCFLFCVVLWLLYMAVVPFGKINYVYDFKGDNYFIKKFTPDTRVLGPQNGKLKIIGEPVYFSLNTQRTFDKSRLVLKYRRCDEGKLCNSMSLPVIESGVLTDKTIWRYELGPIENHIIDQLALVWDVIDEDGTLLLQREKKFSSIDEFLSSELTRSEIALYNYDLDLEYLIPDYQASSEEKNIDLPIRGPYQFYTYVKDEEFNFNFSIVDININNDLDPVDLLLYYKDELIESRHLDDDGIEPESGKASEDRELKIQLSNLPEGIYKLEVRANDDIITKKIRTRQSKLAFINKIWLSDTGKENFKLTLFTDSREIGAKTANPNKLQAIRIGNTELNLEETYKQYNIKTKTASTTIVLNKDDLVISGDGIFSLDPGSLINPNIRKVDANLDVNKDGINNIIADYTSPDKRDGWNFASVDFDLKQAYREKGSYGFIFVIPGLRADDERDDWIEVDEIRVELEGKTLFQKINEIFN